MLQLTRGYWTKGFLVKFRSASDFWRISFTNCSYVTEYVSRKNTDVFGLYWLHARYLFSHMTCHQVWPAIGGLHVHHDGCHLWNMTLIPFLSFWVQPPFLVGFVLLKLCFTIYCFVDHYLSFIVSLFDLCAVCYSVYGYTNVVSGLFS